MQLKRVMTAMAVSLAVPAFAAAQTGTTATTASQTATESYGVVSTGPSQWIVSGFVGSNFGLSAEKSSVDYGGSLGYLYRNWIGAEFLAGFTPNFEVGPQNLALFNGDRPDVNSYMANGIVALPLGADGRWQPFVSGGFGALDMRSSVGSPIDQLYAPNDTRAGGNIGAGLMAFAGNVGIRGDIRYFRAFSSNSPAVSGDQVSFLPGLDFWRGNIGIAFHW
jgi:hypothetical protein